MPDINNQGPVGPLHTERIRVERRHARVPLVLGTLAVLALLAIPFFPKADQPVAHVAPAAPVLAERPITVNQQPWRTQGAPQAYAEGRMARVGITDQGEPLFASRDEGYLGGGGGQGTAELPSGHVYMLTRDGRYQAIVTGAKRAQ